MNKTISCEAAVRKLRTMPEQAKLVRDAYLDEDNLTAAKRFAASEEFEEILDLLGKRIGQAKPWCVLDIGAGNGIAAYAFAKAGHKVIALEPDPSPDIGAGAIKRLAKVTALDITVLINYAEQIPLLSSTIDVVYARQVLHHVTDLNKIIAEAFRILRPGGLFFATREHVVDDNQQLASFLKNHPLHKWTGAEYAYKLSDYKRAIQHIGFKIELQLGPLETVINYFPTRKAQVAEQIRVAARHRFGVVLGDIISSSHLFQHLMAKRMSDRNHNPGRLYSLLARKVF